MHDRGCVHQLPSLHWRDAPVRLHHSSSYPSDVGGVRRHHAEALRLGPEREALDHRSA